MKALAAMMMVAGLGFGTSAKAIDLRNEDTVARAVKITSSAMTRDIQLSALTLQFIVCVGECTFEIEGLGTVRASKDDVITIADGKVAVSPGRSRTAAR